MSAGRSLHLRLLAAAAVSVTLALAVAGVVLSDLFAGHVRARQERELANHLDQLAAAVEPDASGRPALIRPLSDPRFQRPLSGLYWQVSAGDLAVLRSRSLWDAALALPGDGLTDGDLHVHQTLGPEGAPVIVAERLLRFAGGDDGRFRLAVAEANAELNRAGGEFNRTLALSLVALAGVLVVATAVQVSIGLQPLRRLRSELAEIRAGRRERFELGLAPAEIVPLIGDLNHLLEHSAEVVARARVHAGNLAHGLKTGLAVIGNELDLLDPVAAATLRPRLDDMLRQINHHLGRARAAAAAGLPGWRTEVAPVVVALRRTLLSLYADRPPAITIECSSFLTFAGEKEDLEEVLGNLLDNACKWTAGQIQVSAHTTHDGDDDEGSVGKAASQQQCDTWIKLEIEDDGPGLPEGREAEILNRGVRLDESVPGTGLGLGIVRDLTALYGGRVAFSRSSLGGLKVTVLLPESYQCAAASNFRPPQNWIYPIDIM
ncbi:two-component system, OmpR family, sensor histidine kinase PhoQ [uncultured Gammaproteobacteria bacterium]